MDPLLRQLQSLSIGASVSNMYVGGFLHADDIHMLASTATTLEAQISTVKTFTEDSFLNTIRCEIVAFKKSSVGTNQESIKAGECSFPVSGEAICLIDYQWKQDLSFSSAIQNNIQRARNAYFQFGSIHAFQGKLSPVPSPL